MNIPGLGEVTGCVVAWRTWKVSRGRLRAASAGVEWPPGEPLEACCLDNSCTLQAAHAPQRHGIYASKKPERWMLPVIGEVALWGRIIEHEFGYRAQYGYPVRLFTLEEDPEMEELGVLYGVPVEPLPGEVARAFLAKDYRPAPLGTVGTLSGMTWVVSNPKKNALWEKILELRSNPPMTPTKPSVKTIKWGRWDDDGLS